MKIEVLEEAGRDWALLGMAFSYKDRKIPWRLWWTPEQQAKAIKRAGLLAHKDGGHNKFLESIQVWFIVEASRDFWSEMDTYRVGMTKQSESTMHTLSKRPPEFEDFEEGTDEETFLAFLKSWERHRGSVTKLKKNLPEGFLQARVVNTNYKVLRNVLWQREGHRLEQWTTFREELLAQLEHPEYLVQPALISDNV